jgi:hypothetical protein
MVHRMNDVLYHYEQGASMIRVAVWGTGMMGQGLLGYILDRPGQVELVGAIDIDPAKQGMTVGELLGRECPVKITSDSQAVLATRPDVVCVLTASNLQEITDPVEASVRAGANVIGIAETLAYPWASDPEWAERFSALAKEHGVSILGDRPHRGDARPDRHERGARDVVCEGRARRCLRMSPRGMGIQRR